MAFNLKGLFSKLKPAASTIANYGDDVAGAVAKYGDDAAKALTTYSDDVVGLLPSPGNYKTGTDILSNAYGRPLDSDFIENIMETPYALPDGGTVFRYGFDPKDFEYASPANVLAGDVSGRKLDVETRPMWKMLKDGDYEFPVPVDDSYLQLSEPIPSNYLAEQDEMIHALTNPQVMDDLDTALQFGERISNFNNTSDYVDQMLSPTPNWTSRWGDLERNDTRIQNLYNQLLENFDRWTDFEYTFGHTPPHVNTGDLADQIIRLERLGYLKR
jgi:hypothetical protein